jgi:hypothetical protein
MILPDFVLTAYGSTNPVPGLWEKALANMPKGVDLLPRLITALLTSVVGVSITRFASRLQYLDRRSERVRLVGEASSILQLRQHMQAIVSGDALCEIVNPLRSRIDDFARVNLLKVEEALRIETEVKTKTRSRSWLLRFFPLYQPARPWLWMHHALYFAALGSMLFPFWGALNGVHQGDYLLHALAERWAHILGAFLAAVFFAWLAYANECRLSPSPALEPDCEDERPRLHRPLQRRLFLCFQPHGGVMWTAHLLFLASVGLIIRFAFVTIVKIGVTDLIDWPFLLIVGVLVFVPLAVFNLTSNYCDMRRAHSAAQATRVAPRRFVSRAWRMIRHLLLFIKPKKWWFWFFQVPSYLALLITAAFTALTFLFCLSVNSPWWVYPLLPLIFLPLAFWNMFIALIDGILKVQSQVAPPVEVAV